MLRFFDLLAHSRHTLGIVGLVMNTLGAFGLIPFPPDLKGFRRDGRVGLNPPYPQWPTHLPDPEDRIRCWSLALSCSYSI
jgi:hypothetical protein